MKNIRLLIFDWDGTLIDSERKIINCFTGAAKDLHVGVPAEESICDVIGLGLGEAFSTLYPGLDGSTLDHLVDRYRQYFIELDNTRMEFFPGVDGGIKRLSDMGYCLAIATGKARRGLRLAMQGCSFANLFAATRCADETNSKPHPQMLCEILEETRTAPDEALMIGDSIYDLQMASNAGISALAVSYGVQKEHNLRLHSPLDCLDSFQKVLQWLSINTKPSISA